MKITPALPDVKAKRPILWLCSGKQYPCIYPAQLVGGCLPFFLVTVFCFANSSQQLHSWFLGTKLYKNHLDSFVKKEGMTVRTKATIMTSVTLLMGFGFFMMVRKGLIIPCVILAVVWCAIWSILCSGSRRFGAGESQKRL
jgi:uncharacterized membrane protein YbaN (DUF454 family)